MKINKVVKREVEEEILDKKMICDNCEKEIENLEACGYGAEYHLLDKWCSGCGGKTYDFCCLDCLKDFVSKISKGEK